MLYLRRQYHLGAIRIMWYMERYQYTAIDDATRVRALQIYDRHTQKNAIHFVNHGIEKFPFRIQQIRTDRGHEFQAQFHWHVEDLGIRHVYIKARTPQLNGKVERSHRSDQNEFYQLLSYKDDRNLHVKLAEWRSPRKNTLRSPERKAIINSRTGLPDRIYHTYVPDVALNTSSIYDYLGRFYYVRLKLAILPPN